MSQTGCGSEFYLTLLLWTGYSATTEGSCELYKVLKMQTEVVAIDVCPSFTFLIKSFALHRMCRKKTTVPWQDH